MITKKCFVGIEAEGPYRGTQTLFVPGSFPEDQLIGEKLPAAIQLVCKNIYYGAGEDWEYQGDLVMALCGMLRWTLSPNMNLLVERKLNKELYVIDFSTGTIYHKLVSKSHITWWLGGTRISSCEKNDPLFLQDTEI